MKLNETLNETFNVESMPVAEPIRGEIITKSGEVIVPQQQDIDQNVDYDYDKTRNNLHTLLSQGQEALMAALEVAKSSEHPRAFEVVGGLMKQLADINHQLLDLSDKRQKMLSKTPTKETGGSSGVTNNNAIFVGSTTELNKMLQNMTKGV